jgi:cyclophilin family peptidyl-prolyl cis-trans isomerase
MSANPTPTTATQSPTPVELLWERYKSLAYVVVFGALGALGVNYALKNFEQKKVDSTWSAFATNLGIDGAYQDPTRSQESLTDAITAQDAAKLKAALDTATPDQKPFVLLALAKKAVAEKDWATAEGHLAALEAGYPNHSLVRSTPHPVQVQPAIPDPSSQNPATQPNKPKKPELKPPEAGSAVGRLRDQIKQAKDFTAPAHFAKPEIPADATKIKFDLSGDYGSFTIALMPQAPKHAEAFKKLAEAKFWEGIAVDEIRRPVKILKQPHEMHIGFESTKSDDRDLWKDTDPSKNILDFEKSGLSHFPGAVSARNEADGKSCADRFWVAVDDAARYDNDRVVFGFVVDGLDNVRRVCEATMRTTQEDEAGRGKTSDVVRVTAVTILP